MFSEFAVMKCENDNCGAVLKSEAKFHALFWPLLNIRNASTDEIGRTVIKLLL
jgi:hypothetical protein